MKQDIINDPTIENSDEREVTFVKRAGAVLGAGALAVLAVGAVGIYAFVGGSTIPKSVDAKVLVAGTSAAAESEESSISQAAETWRKAGIDEYDLVVETVKATSASSASSTVMKKAVASKNETTSVKATAKTTTTKLSTTAASTTTSKNSDTETQVTTAAPVTTTTPARTETAVVVEDSTADEIKDCGTMTKYTSEGVNLREEPSLSGGVLKVLEEGAEVTVTGYNDEWYRIKADGESGYCLKKYLTDEKPVDENAPEEKTSDSYTVSCTDEEFQMFIYVLQNEVGNCSEESKIAVANVILNRVKSPLFPNTIYEVLTAPGQFDAIYNYYNPTHIPTDNTIECAKRALSGEDNSNGAIYYYAPAYCGGETAAWFETLTFCTEIDGQRYFK